MDQRIINLYDEYTHKPLNRNEFLRRLALLAGSVLLMGALSWAGTAASCCGSGCCGNGCC